MVRYYFLHLPQSHEKIVATSKHVFPSEIIVGTESSVYQGTGAKKHFSVANEET
jgi:hypothetical protein